MTLTSCPVAGPPAACHPISNWSNHDTGQMSEWSNFKEVTLTSCLLRWLPCGPPPPAISLASCLLGERETTGYDPVELTKGYELLELITCDTVLIPTQPCGSTPRPPGRRARNLLSQRVRNLLYSELVTCCLSLALSLPAAGEQALDTSRSKGS